MNNLDEALAAQNSMMRQLVKNLDLIILDQQAALRLLESTRDILRTHAEGNHE